MKLLHRTPFSASFEMSDFLHLMQEKFRLLLRRLERGCLQLDGEVWNLTNSSQLIWEHHFIINTFLLHLFQSVTAKDNKY